MEEGLDAADQAQMTAIVPHERTDAAISQAAAAADRAASSALFAEYRRQLAARTRSAHDQDLARCALYLADVGVAVGALAVEPTAWVGCTWGLVEGFKRWMLREGYALATLNRTLATITSYTRLAAQAGALSAEQATLIAAVKGYGRKQGRNLDADRATTRRSAKKAAPIRLSLAHARALKEQPGTTPQGRRDALLICLLLDHGLRVGEVAALTIGSVDLAAGTLTFYREKVDLTQTHLLSAATLRAALAYFQQDALAQQRGTRCYWAVAEVVGCRARSASAPSRPACSCSAETLASRSSPHTTCATIGLQRRSPVAPTCWRSRRPAAGPRWRCRAATLSGRRWRMSG